MKTITDELFLSIEKQLDRLEQLNDTVYDTAKKLITEPMVSDEDFTWLCDLNESLTNFADNFSKFVDMK
jgi:hypothetical protein